MRTGDFGRAASLAGEAKGLAPRSGRLRELLGLAYYQTGAWHEALSELLAYRRLTAFLDENHVIADCYRALGNTQRALTVCREVKPDRVSLAVWTETVIVAASTLADQGELARAIAELKHADLEPRQVQPYHLRLWYVRADLLERAGRMAEARAAWERIYAEDPDFFDVAERLGLDGHTVPGPNGHGPED
jgi:tetratricopeptide (TPR) repeat protein